MHLNTYTKTYKDKLRVKTGNSGEELVLQCYPQAKRGDWYDAKKDGTIDENTYEVKSQRLNIKYQGFWIDQNQFKKLDGVDLLFFVQIPETSNDSVKLFLAPNHTKTYQTKTRPTGEYRIYPLNKCLQIREFADKSTIDEFYEPSKELRTYKNI